LGRPNRNGKIPDIPEMKMSDLTQFRTAKDEFFSRHDQSPLTPKQKSNFEGLAYFPENQDLRLTLKVEQFPQQEEIVVQTSTGDSQTYTRYGNFSFEIDGETATLTILTNDYGYFLPFVDSLANTETYGAGRYLEFEFLGGGQFLIDFNLAYNPYCAYNDSWSCPLTPWENRVKVPIRAGEKIFKE